MKARSLDLPKTRYPLPKLLSLLLLLLVGRAQAQFSYSTNNGSITILQYTGSGGDVVIPDTITGLPVTAVADNAFKSKGITSVVVPATVLYIGKAAFASCAKLLTITVDEANPAYSSSDGVLFDKTQTTLIQYPGGKTEPYTIPSSVTNIWQWAFAGCVGLTNFTIPDTVVSVGDSAFANCLELQSLRIGAGVTSIGINSFAGCQKLSDLTLGTALANIGAGAFLACKSLTNVITPDAVTTIGLTAFAQCQNLTNVTLNEGLKSIGANTFQQTAITSITVPGTVTNLSSAFATCQIITNIVLSDGIPSLGDMAFFNCYKLANLSVPSSVTNIGNRTFESCRSLTRLTLTGAIRIGTNAFSACSSLTNVLLGKDLAYISDWAFDRCSALKAIYFTGDAPAFGFAAVGSALYATAYYLPGTAGWGPTLDNVPTLLWNPQIQFSASEISLWTNGCGFNVVGTPTIPVLVEACSDFGNSGWTPLQSCTLTNGAVYFTDPSWTNYSARFYRVRSP